MFSKKIERVLSWVVLTALLALTFVARCHNRKDIFHDDQRIYFHEGDCYSRMERAQMVDAGQWVIRHHDFENWPQGIDPHTTGPLDWLIVALKRVLAPLFAVFLPKSILHGQELDLAGALVSPLLGVATAAWLWWWAGRMWLPFRWLMVLFFAVSPVLVDATLLGRPDHQSLLVFLIAVGVGTELALADPAMPANLARRWSIGAGVAWGLALWVSFYEPLIFFVGAIGRHLLFHRGALFAKAVKGRWIGLAGVMILAVAIDGWRLTLPDAAMREQFAAWGATVAELRHLNLAHAAIWHWTGLFWISGFVLLWRAARRDPRSFSVLLLVAVMLVLTIWQLRWAYYFALAVAISIPWQVGVLGRRGWIAGLAAMIPLIFAWSNTLHPGPEEIEKREWARAVSEEWRHVAESMRSPEKRPFLAPWWASPQVAYWSGQPGLAGTSHQSLPGIRDTARFYLTEKPEEAATILRERGVRYVIADDLTHTSTNLEEYLMISNSRQVLGMAETPANPLGKILADHPKLAPPFLHYVTPKERGLVQELPQVIGNSTPDGPKMELYRPQYHQLYIVEPDKL